MSKAPEKKRAPEAAKKNAPKESVKPKKKGKELSDDELAGASGGLMSTSSGLTSALNRAGRTPGA